MLHPLKPPDRQCEGDLIALIAWQRKTLQYARDHTQFLRDTFRQFMGDDFVDWFEDSRRNGHKKQKTAFNKFKQSLEDLVKCDSNQKQMVLNDFEHDQDFYLHLDEPAVTTRTRRKYHVRYLGCSA